MRRFLFAILAVTIYAVGISNCCADESDSISPDQAHMQLVNQALDNIEPSGNGPVNVSPPPVQNNQNINAASFLIPKKNELQFGSEFYWAKNEEPKILNQKGFMSGYNAQFTHRTTNDPNAILNVFRFQGQWAGGKFKTEPVDQGPSGMKVSTYDLRAMLGKDSYVIPHMRTTLYAGFGYRYLEDDAGGLSTVFDNFTLLGYNTYSHYTYVPIGLDMVYQTKPRYSLEGNLEYDYVPHAWEVAKLGVVPGYSTLTFDETHGEGLRASLRLNLYFKYCTAYVEGFYRLWNIATSKGDIDPTDPSSVLVIPKNNTEEFGLKLGVQV